MGQGKQLGEVATLHLPDKNIHYLVTKSKFYHKPSYQILWQSLWYLKEYCVNHHDQFLAMPKIGCGIDKLNWDFVFSMVKYIFKNSNIIINIYCLNLDYKDICKINVEESFTPVWDRDVVKREQSKDAFCTKIVTQLKVNDESTKDMYFLDDDGILFKSDQHDENDKLVIPETYIAKTLHDYHALPYAGHAGQAKYA
ncbi:hypothetical protein NQ314_019393 [Rhamnusium bicolor]|uniref:Macro domain-containing protein n=1 Tax=Rhamnusium bicolor TaxID=1586634 RepID=A0AAV8WNK9_9CUCU|nr:hypothetical protein NQ314_019393 [Rhamnusium bicolor]